MKSKNSLPCVYIAQSATTRKVYIGQSIVGLTRRKRNHIRNRIKATKGFDLAIRELGPDDFFWEILFVIEDTNLSKEEVIRLLNEKEKFYIKEYNAIEEGYNLDGGGKNYLSKYTSWGEKDKAHKERHRLKRLDSIRNAKYLATRRAARRKRIVDNPEKYKEKIKIQNNKRKKIELQQKRAQNLNMTLEEYIVYRQIQNQKSKEYREKRIARDPEGYKKKRDNYKKLNQHRDSLRKKEYRKTHPEYIKKQKERNRQRRKFKELQCK